MAPIDKKANHIRTFGIWGDSGPVNLFKFQRGKAVHAANGGKARQKGRVACLLFIFRQLAGEETWEGTFLQFSLTFEKRVLVFHNTVRKNWGGEMSIFKSMKNEYTRENVESR